MGNWAIVIGIDQYWKADANLRGAVSDALKIRAWLLDPNGGQVASDKLALFLAPMHPSVPCRLASHLDIYDYINWLVNIKQAQGERLFFYFSGHGMAAPMTTTYVDALLPTDFTDLRTHLSFQLDKLLEYFQTSKFMDQFFFIDACRNIPWAGQLCAVGNPFLRGLDPKLPAVQQFVFRATSPGIGAAEISQAGSERGAFTEVLLEGLTHGKGQAKVYDSARGDYVVRVGKLFEFVKKKVSETRTSTSW